MYTASTRAESPFNGPLLPEPWVVRETIRENRNIVTLVLGPGEGVTPRPYLPGQFNMLYRFGIGDSAISISGDTAREEVLVHTIRNVGSVTRALCRSAVGDTVGVRGPFGSDWPIGGQRGRDLVIVAGGIGMAPLRPVLYYIVRHRGDFGRVTLLYGAREPGDHLYTAEMQRWRDHDIHVELTVDTADHGWNGNIGVVTSIIRLASFRPGITTVFICGPEVMMRFVALEFQTLGVAPERILVSMERNMKCAVGFCGHCQLGPEFVCTDGAVFPWPRVAHLTTIREL